MLRNNMNLIIVIWLLTLLKPIKEILINKYCNTIGVCKIKKPTLKTPSKKDTVLSIDVRINTVFAINIRTNSMTKNFIISFFIPSIILFFSIQS